MVHGLSCWRSLTIDYGPSTMDYGLWTFFTYFHSSFTFTQTTMRLKEKIALITGGANGIGLATVSRFAKEGAKIIFWDVSDKGKDIAAQLKKDGHDVLFKKVSVTNESEVQKAVAEAKTHFGRIDILINNAGITPSAPLDRMDLSMWNQVLAINLTGAFLCSRAALADMYANKWGRIVNVASIAGLQGGMYISAYCASKHGMIGMTRALAKEAAKKGVTVNAICPGYVETDIIARAAENIASKTKLNEEEARAMLYAGNPQGRLITADEVASAIAWLCSDGAAATNGAAIPMSGGEV
jgi:3-hydroxybutyrate dehydrogenase